MTRAIAERLEALGRDPIEGMARIAMDESQPIGLRVQMYKELAQYVAPKRKALEHKGGDRWARTTRVRDRHRATAY
jgi:hypothetical protein